MTSQAALTVNVVPSSSKPSSHRFTQSFIRNQGHTVVAELLELAGLHGFWTLRTSSPFKCCSGTPVIRVKQIVHTPTPGVRIGFKPKANNSGVIGLLVVPKPHDIDDVFERLKQAEHRVTDHSPDRQSWPTWKAGVKEEATPKTAFVRPVEFDLGWSDQYRVLEAVSGVSNKSLTHKDIYSFFNELRDVLNEDLSDEWLIQACEYLAVRKTLISRPNYYILSPFGEQVLAAGENKEDPEYITPFTNEAGDILERSVRLQDLFKAAQELKLCRERQRRLLEELEARKALLRSERELELKITEIATEEDLLALL